MPPLDDQLKSRSCLVQLAFAHGCDTFFEFRSNLRGLGEGKCVTEHRVDGNLEHEPEKRRAQTIPLLVCTDAKALSHATSTFYRLHVCSNVVNSKSPDFKSGLGSLEDENLRTRNAKSPGFVWPHL